MRKQEPGDRLNIVVNEYDDFACGKSYPVVPRLR
jgi:hypothetical protein